MIYALKEKGTNRAIALIDESLKPWFSKNMPLFDIIEVESVGSCHTTTEKGFINTISISPKDGRDFELYMVKAHSEKMTDSEANYILQQREEPKKPLDALVNGSCFRINQKVTISGIKDEDSFLNNLTGTVINPFGFGETNKGYVGVCLDKKGIVNGDCINVHADNLVPNIANSVDLMFNIVELSKKHSDSYIESQIYAKGIWSLTDIADAIRYYNPKK